MAVPAAGVNVGGAQSANNRWIASAFLQGQPLSAGLPGGTGEFTIGVRGVIAANSWAPGPLKSTTVFTTNYLSG
jgi:hypothetical protein